MDGSRLAGISVYVLPEPEIHTGCDARKQEECDEEEIDIERNVCQNLAVAIGVHAAQ